MSGLTLDNSAGNVGLSSLLLLSTKYMLRWYEWLTKWKAANSLSDGDPAAHNSDGFDFSSSNNIILKDSWVSNQDDCVAVTSGVNVTVSGMTCKLFFCRSLDNRFPTPNRSWHFLSGIGGHGLSIGSVGLKSNNVVDGVTFKDSTISASENGCRIKTNSGATGSVCSFLLIRSPCQSAQLT